VSRIAVLCDFDGTIARDDVGNLFFRTFGGPGAERIVDEWKNGAISSRTCMEREASLVKASRHEVDRFVCRCKLDPYFKDFIDFTARNDIEVVIVSDGLDHYIENMLMRNGLGDLQFYANVTRFGDGRLTVEFPYYDLRDCRDCGNCKTHHLEKFRRAGYYIIYVGNGLSDRCPATHSDLVFAKSELLEFCRQNGLNHVPYGNFRDVEREMLSRFVLRDGASGVSPLR
jgi:2,3-diketo-5-methylthio-1-phosphopentane phosphatase